VSKTTNHRKIVGGGRGPQELQVSWATEVPLKEQELRFGGPARSRCGAKGENPASPIGPAKKKGKREITGSRPMKGKSSALLGKTSPKEGGRWTPRVGKTRGGEDS